MVLIVESLFRFLNERAEKQMNQNLNCKYNLK